MPTYEYRCPKGHHFELFQRMSDEPTALCPECGAASERLLSGGAGFLFKGEGFYITDYRSDSYRKAAKADDTSSGKAAGEAKGSASDGEKPKSSGSTESSSGGESTSGGPKKSPKADD